MRTRSLSVVTLALAAALGVAGCSTSSSTGNDAGSGGGSSSSAAKGPVVVGSASFTENKILASMYEKLLDKAGYDASVKVLDNSEIIVPSLKRGDLAVVPEYVATFADFLNTQQNGPDAKGVSSSSVDDSLAALQKLAQTQGLKALQPAQAVDQNAFAVSKDFAAKHNLKTLSDLGQSGIPVTIAAGSECAVRPFCAPGLKSTYGIKVKGIDKLGVDTLQTKQAVKTGKDELGLVLTTDGTLDDFNLVALEDDKMLQHADNLVPVVNAKKFPDAAVPVLNKLAGVLTTQDLAQLNKKVDAQRMDPDQVAEDYLKSKGLL